MAGVAAAAAAAAAVVVAHRDFHFFFACSEEKKIRPLVLGPAGPMIDSFRVVVWTPSIYLWRRPGGEGAATAAIYEKKW